MRLLIMSETKISNNIYVLRKEIQQIQSELSSLGWVNNLLSGDQDVEEFTGLVEKAGRIAGSAANETPLLDKR